MDALVRILAYLVPEALTEGPVARFIQGWSPRGAIVAWTLLAAGVISGFWGSVATARTSPTLSSILMFGVLLVGYALVFVGLLRSEVRRDNERIRIPRARRVRSDSSDGAA